MQLCFLGLPSELLLETFRRLDYRTLLRCCVVCQRFNEIVNRCVELQYVIELGADGFVDGPENTLAPVDRLALLLDRRKAWAGLGWKRRAVVSLPGTCQAYEFVGGVFAKTMGNGSGACHLIASWLPSANDDGYQLQREDAGLRTRDFAIDPSQDLIAFVQDSENSSIDARRKVLIHLRTLSTNRPHPNARCPIIHCDSEVTTLTAFVQVADDIIGMLIWAQTPQFVLWNWTDGTMILQDDLSPDIWDFSFLSNRAYMLTSCADQGSLEVYSFESRPGSTGSVHVASLLMPDVQYGVEVAHISTHTGPFYRKCVPGTVFTTSPDPLVSRIHVVSIQYATNTGQRMYYVFLHNRTLLSYIPTKAAPDNAVAVSWNEWGPEHTRFIGDQTPFQWLRYVQGQRVVTLVPIDGRPTIQVLDFNVHASRTHANFSELSSESGLVSNMLINYTTRVLVLDVFENHVETRLPYYVVSRICTERYSGAMIDEERIIGLKSDASGDGDIGDIHVFAL